MNDGFSSIPSELLGMQSDKYSQTLTEYGEGQNRQQNNRGEDIGKLNHVHATSSTRHDIHTIILASRSTRTTDPLQRRRTTDRVINIILRLVLS